MPIGPITMFAIYIVVWWVVLFAVLPLGTSAERHEAPPTDGAQWGGTGEAEPEAKIHHHDLGFGSGLVAGDGAGLHRLDASAGHGTSSALSPADRLAFAPLSRLKLTFP